MIDGEFMLEDGTVLITLLKTCDELLLDLFESWQTSGDVLHLLTSN